MRNPKKLDGHRSLDQDHSAPAHDSTLKLISTLCETLELEEIAYCHWKSNNALARSATGENDLDLLIASDDAQRFTEILYRLGFKETQTPVWQAMPGVVDYYGYDSDSGKLVQVQAHYRLVVGDDRTKNYHLPIETSMLASTIKKHGFRIPTPEFEFIVFVIRMMLKRFTWDAVLEGRGALSIAERKEWTDLQLHVRQPEMVETLRHHLPFLDTALFDSCLESLQPGVSVWRRIYAAQRLLICLKPYTRRRRLTDLCLKAWRRLELALRRRLCPYLPRKRFASGGMMIAIVGGDGSGKTSAVEELKCWLAKDFELLMVHMGKPSWSWITLLVRGVVKIGRSLGFYPYIGLADVRYAAPDTPPTFPGYPVVLREVCAARDRYLTYVKARRFVSRGGLVICDRFPVPQVRLMDGAQVQHLTGQHTLNRVLKALIAREQSYYKPMLMPELWFVLSVDPEIAVQRKTDEDADYVRARSTEIWNLDWRGLSAHVIDASRSKQDVLSELKSVIWSHL